MSFLQVLFRAVCCMLVLSGCIFTQPQDARNTIDRAGFNSRTVYVHRGQLAEDMSLMMQGVTNLMTIEVDSSISDARRHSRIIRELRVLQNAAKVIRDGTEITGYSENNPYMGAFLHDIRMAMEFAEMTPPDYQPATSLIKSCVYCHKHRD